MIDSEQNQTYFRKEFTNIDIENTGLIGASKLRRYFNERIGTFDNDNQFGMNSQMTINEAKDIIYEFDNIGEGKLQFPEFSKLFKPACIPAYQQSWSKISTPYTQTVNREDINLDL